MILDSLNPIIEALFDWTWRTSFYASVLILLVWLLQWCGAKWLTARWRYGLGLLVLIRLLLPVVPEASFSIFNLARRVVPAPTPAESRPLIPVEVDAIPLGTASPVTIEPTGLAMADQKVSDRFAVAKFIWCAGWLGSLLIVWRQHRQFSRGLVKQPVVDDERVLSILESARAMMRVRGRITVMTTSRLTTPALFGWRQPRVLIPEAMQQRLDDRELRMVFLHELAHLKRGDILLNWIMIVARSLHWFNPLVWLALRRLRADRELARDAMVLERLADDERRAYGNTLIKLLDDFSPAGFCPSLAPVIHRKHEIKRRIAMISQFKPAGRIALLLSAAIVITLCCFTFTRAADRPVAGAPLRTPTQQPEPQPAVEPQSRMDGTEALRNELAKLEERVREAQARVDSLRQHFPLAESFGATEVGSRTGEARQFESERIRLESEHRQLDAMLVQLKARADDTAEFESVISVAVPDDLLTALLKTRAESELKVANLLAKFGADHPELKPEKEMNEKIHEQINRRVEGIMSGLQLRANVARAQITSLRKAELEISAENAASAAEYRGYFEAKRELENLMRIRDAIRFRILQEVVDAAAPGTPLQRR